MNTQAIYNLINNNSVDDLEYIGKHLSDFEEIPSNGKNYTLLGKGNFGYCEKMKSKKNNSIYAIKKIDKDNQKFKEKNYKREIGIMSDTRHENILRIYGFFEDIEKKNKYNDIYDGTGNETINDKQICCLVLEYAPNGSLKDYYNNHMEKYKEHYIPIDQKFIIKILKQGLNVLTYFLQKSILHRDIKPDNILLDNNFNIKVADFGISALFKDGNPTNSGKETILFGGRTIAGCKPYVPPEILNKEYFNTRCDIFSLGLTMLVLMSKENPITFINGIRDINYNNMDINYDLYLRKLVLRMIDKDYNLRPYSNEVYNELEIIEKLIMNPQDENSKNYLDKVNQDFQNKKINSSQKNIQINPNINYNPNNVQNIQFNPNINSSRKNFPNNQFNQFNHNFVNQNYPNYPQIPNNVNIPMNISQQMNFINQNNMQFINNNIMPQNNPIYQNNPINYQNNRINYQNNPINFQNNPINYQNNPINFQNNQFMGKKYKNTSFIRVLQCLYYILNGKTKKLNSFKLLITGLFKTIDINNCFSMDIINAFSLFENNNFNNKDFSNEIQKSRNKFAKRITRFNGEKEIEPKWVIYDIFSNLNEELKKNNIPWNNLIFNNFVPPRNLPAIDIQYFQREYHTPFVDFFYYILFNQTKCENCKSILDERDLIAYFIPLPGNRVEKVSNLIKEYFSPTDSENIYTCNICNYNGKGKVEKFFYNTPEYLIIDFEDTKRAKDLDDAFDVNNYTLTNVGPKKYKLYAFIFKENEEYKAFIRTNSVWNLYWGQNNISRDNLQSYNSFYPYIAIYRGE